MSGAAAHLTYRTHKHSHRPTVVPDWMGDAFVLLDQLDNVDNPADPSPEDLGEEPDEVQDLFEAGSGDYDLEADLESVSLRAKPCYQVGAGCQPL